MIMNNNNKFKKNHHLLSRWSRLPFIPTQLWRASLVAALLYIPLLLPLSEGVIELVPIEEEAGRREAIRAAARLFSNDTREIASCSTVNPPERDEVADSEVGRDEEVAAGGKEDRGRCRSMSDVMTGEKSPRSVSREVGTM